MGASWLDILATSQPLKNSVRILLMLGNVIFENIVAKEKIIFIAGASRSGSTILSQLLGLMGGVSSLGEIAHIWERGLAENGLCGCGKNLRQCDYWTAVLNEAFPGGTEDHLDDFIEATSSAERFRHLPFHLFSFAFPGFTEKVKFLSEQYLEIFRGAAFVTGDDLLVDSSKHVHGHVLVTIPGIDLYVIHLVRDGRATTYSWSRTKVFEKQPEKTIYFPRYSPLVAAMHWSLDNLSAELLKFRAKRYLRVKYEDFARDPRETVKNILDFAQFEYNEIPIAHDGRTVLDIQHSVSGNAARFRVGKTAIRIDDQWKSEMSRNTKFWISLVLFPLLLRYGYFSK